MAILKPAKLLPVTFTLGVPEPVDINGLIYRFNATLTSLNPQLHSDSSEGFSYDLTDVNVGDYVTTEGGGRIMKIVSIASQTTTTATIVVEDEFRLNQQQDSSQNLQAYLTGNPGVVFEVVEGRPILYPYSDKSTEIVGFIEKYATEIISRFSYQREQTLITITQGGTDQLTLAVGDLITFDTLTEKYKLFEPDDILVIGTVVEVENPTADTFRINPAGERIDIELPGTGPFYYFDNANPGKVTETPPIENTRNIPVFFKFNDKQAIYFDGGVASASNSSGIENNIFNQGTITVNNGTVAFSTYKLYVLFTTTIDDTPTEMFLDGSNTRIDLPEDSTMMFEADIIGRDSTGTDHCSFRLQGLVDRTSGSTVLVNTVNEVVVAETDDTWSATVEADDVNDTIAVKVTGAVATTIRWTGFVKTVIVTH